MKAWPERNCEKEIEGKEYWTNRVKTGREGDGKVELKGEGKVECKTFGDFNLNVKLKLNGEVKGNFTGYFWGRF